MRLEVEAILPTVLEFLALSNLPAPVAEGTVGQPKALTCLRQRSSVVHSFRDQLVGFAAILVTDQFSLSPQIACVFFINTKSADNSTVTLSFRAISLWDKR